MEGRTAGNTESVQITCCPRDRSSPNRGVLNVCCPYSSRDEIARAVQTTIRDVEEETIDPRFVSIRHLCSPLNLTRSDICSSAIYSNLELCKSVHGVMPDESARWDGDDVGKLDILVRTSNVKRLSDFMMWQVRLGSDWLSHST